MQPISKQIQSKPWLGWLLFFITAAVVFFLGILVSSIMERRSEAVFAYTPQLKFDKFEPRNKVWGENFPREYQSYLLTSDTSLRTKYNGSATIDMLGDDPRLVSAAEDRGEHDRKGSETGRWRRAGWSA